MNFSDKFLDLKVSCPYCGVDKIVNTGEWPGKRVYTVCWNCDKGYYRWIRKEYEREYSKHLTEL